MADPFVGEIRIFPFSFAPKGWAWCNGQLLPISQNTALFSLLGTTYGGDGRTTFALPDLEGRGPMHPGQGPGLSLHDLGETGGSETVTLLQSEMPFHTHTLQANFAQADLQAPGPARVLARSAGGSAYQSTSNANLVQMHPQGLTPAGGDQPHNNLQPYLTFYFNIALQGVFPAEELNDMSRSSTGTTDVALRQATEHDRDFLAGVYASTRDEELSQVAWADGARDAFVRMQFDAQDAEYHRLNPAGSFDVIEVGGRPAGRLYVDRRPGDIRIVDISLLPEFRGAGVGGRLIARLIDEAATSGRKLSVHVEIHNRAAELYARMGFAVAAEQGVYRRMEWTAP